jgi:hypothetical protein
MYQFHAVSQVHAIIRCDNRMGAVRCYTYFLAQVDTLITFPTVPHVKASQIALPEFMWV